MTRDEVTRSFWARFLESKVGADGKVVGFDGWWSKALPYARDRGMRYAESCWRKVSGGRAVDEVIAAGVSAFRGELRLTRVASEAKDPIYSRYRFELVHQIRRDGLRPFEVAVLLERDKFEHPQITDDEIDLYREWGTSWGGPIEEGRPVWNPRTSQLEPWPHQKPMTMAEVDAAIEPPPIEVPAGQGERILAAVANAQPGEFVPIDDDEPPPPE